MRDYLKVDKKIHINAVTCCVNLYVKYINVCIHTHTHQRTKTFSNMDFQMTTINIIKDKNALVSQI